MSRSFSLLLLSVVTIGCATQRSELSACLGDQHPFVEDFGADAFFSTVADYEQTLVRDHALAGSTRSGYQNLLERVAAGDSLPSPEPFCDQHPNCWQLNGPSAYLAYPVCMAQTHGVPWQQEFERGDAEGGFDAAWYQRALSRLSDEQFADPVYRAMFTQWLYYVAEHEHLYRGRDEQ